MAAKDRDAALREMAAHRGFRLVKSRRRTPGVGDYGRYGLADAKSGREGFGFGPDGLTATAEDIAAHLRGTATASWHESAETTPDLPERTAKADASPDPPPPATPAPLRRPSRRPGPARAKPPRPAPTKPEPPKPEPELAIRAATRGDAGAIVRLMAGMADAPGEPAIAAHIAAQARARSPLLVAERGGLVGCLGWAVVPTPHLGSVARMTLLLVAERERRRGIGRALIDAAIPLMAKRGCAVVEAIADIEIRNANAFFRDTGFTRTGYRLKRAI